MVAAFACLMVLGQPLFFATTGMLRERPVWSECGLSLCYCPDTAARRATPAPGATANPGDYCGAPADLVMPLAPAAIPTVYTAHGDTDTRIAFDRSNTRQRAHMLSLASAQLILLVPQSVVIGDAEYAGDMGWALLDAQAPRARVIGVPTPPPRSA